MNTDPLKRISAAALLLALMAVPLLAQDLRVFSPAVEDRAFTRVVYFNPQAQALVAQFAITYGQPKWNAQYAEQLDQIDGRIWRLGSNFWSVLDSQLDIKIADQKVARGAYYLGLEKKGENWNLTLIDQDKVRKARMDASTTIQKSDEVPVVARIPLKMEMVEETAEKLSIALKGNQQMPDRASLNIHFGTFQFSAPIQVETMPSS